MKVAIETDTQVNLTSLGAARLPQAELATLDTPISLDPLSSLQHIAAQAMLILPESRFSGFEALAQ